MDAFEQIVEGLFRQQGYWTWQSYKIDLTKSEKQTLGKPSMPRPEIDILAYRPVENTLVWIECKSFLDSHGVTISGSVVKNAARKSAPFTAVFNDAVYRDIVTKRLVQQLFERGLVSSGVTVQYCLVAGNIYRPGESQLRAYFESNGWWLRDKTWVKEQLRKLSDLSYENDIAIIVAKLFERD